MLCLCAHSSQPFQRRTCLPCIRDLEMEMLCGKGFLNPFKALVTFRAMNLNPPSFCCSFLSVIQACVGTFLFQNVSFILKMLVLAAWSTIPSAF